MKISRVVRTESSEQYFIWKGTECAGQIDLHFVDLVHANIIIFGNKLSLIEISEVLHHMEESLLTERIKRDDLVVSVYRGEDISEEVSSYIKRKKIINK
ncbi:hypothetical protein HY745_04270 [Candidatus Desantisbacteria bacterium]|nr:hypothetical protein [Candidatus Desantisbacteria bacterium]